MKPIIFFAPMVQEILAGNKTQTRRVIKPQPKCDFLTYMRILDKGSVKALANGPDYPDGPEDEVAAPLQPGDILWVRETFGEDKNNWLYKADFCEDDLCKLKSIMRWRSPRYMPRAAARIFLRVTDVRVERVQEISREDAIAEGVTWEPGVEWTCCNDGKRDNAYVSQYADLWEQINAKRGYGWDKNPWVWVYEFERIAKEEAEA